MHLRPPAMPVEVQMTKVMKHLDDSATATTSRADPYGAYSCFAFTKPLFFPGCRLHIIFLCREEQALQLKI